MPKVLIVYGTTDGHTKKVAEAIAKTVTAEGCEADLVLAQEAKPEQRPNMYDAVIVAASLHQQGYQKAVRRWVRRHADALNRKPGAFVSVCLGVLEKRPVVQTALREILKRFYDESGWHPRTTEIVAGAIPYTRYGFIKKWVMRHIARKAGGGTDTTRDYEYTDWAALESFARGFASTLKPRVMNL